MTTANKGPQDPLAVLHVSPWLGRSGYGVSGVVLALAEAQRSLGVGVTLWATDSEREFQEMTQDTSIPQDSLVRFPIVGPARFAFSPAMERAAGDQAARRFALLHYHDLWTGVSRAANRWRRAVGGPTVFTPHGDLAPWCRRRSRWKKWLALRGYAAKNLAHTSCLHALSEAELREFRDFGLKHPVAVIPNGVSQQWLESQGDPQAFRDAYGLPADKRLLLFLGRVTPKKGLPMLLQCMAAARAAMRDWLLVVAGPDEFQHQGELRRQTESLGLEDSVRYVGPVFGPARRDAYAAAQLFVLPSHSEGAPLTVLEALGASVPVLTTKGSPCEYLPREGCGWWAEINAAAIGKALVDAVGRSPSQLAAMGARGQALMQSRFTWSVAARASVALYDWLCGRRDRPDFVVVD